MSDKKKYCQPRIEDRKGDINKRWRVEWYEAHPVTGQPIRKVWSKGLNTTYNPTMRYNRANDFIRAMGWIIPVTICPLQIAFDHGVTEWRPKTTATYRTVLDTFTGWRGKIPADKITSTNISDFLRDCVDKGKRPTTIQKYRNTLSNLYERAVKEDLIKHNPIKKVPRIKRQSVSKETFTDSQIDRLKIAISTDPQLWIAVQLLFYCFIRPGELRGLRVRDINIEMEYVEIRADISKNKKSQKVPIPKPFLPELKLWIAHARPMDFVLSNSNAPGAGQIATKWIEYHHNRAMKTATIQGNYSFYSWKHTGVVKCVQAGLNIRDIQNQLRHHSLDMVQKYLQGLGALQSEDLKYRYPTL